jgi:hypothetical protein
VDIGSLTGSVSIEDQFSSAFTLASSAVKSFADEFDGLAGDVIKGAAIMVTAITTVTAAVITLGIEGSKINEVETGFDRLAGSTENASAILAAMRVGVQGTVSDLTLMTDANKLLQSGVEADAATFGTLTKAAIVLSNEGFGSTSSMMDTLSAAMERGAARGGVLKGATADIAAAEEAMTAQLALQGAPLDKANKLIADRAGIMTFLQGVVSSAGEQELSFGKQVEQVGVSIENWTNQLASAIAISPDLAKAFEAIKGAFDAAFGGDSQVLLNVIVAGVNDFAKSVTYVGTLLSQTISLFSPWVSALAALVKPTVVQFFSDLAAKFSLLAAAISEAQDYVEYWALRMDGMSSSAAHAQIATDNLARSATAQAATAKAAADALDKATAAAIANSPATLAAAAATAAQQKAVDTLITSLVKGTDTSTVLGIAFKDLADNGLLTVAMGAQLLPMMDKVIAQGGTLTQAEKDYYASVVNSRIVLDAKNASELAAQGVSIGAINALKAEGMSVAEIAEAYGTTTAALNLYSKTLATNTAADEALVTAELTAENAAHNNSYATWIALENQKYTVAEKHLEDLGNATDAMYAKIQLDYDNDVADALHAEALKDVNSKAYADKQVDDAQSHLDKMLANYTNYVDADIRLAQQDLIEKQRADDHWAQNATDNINSVAGDEPKVSDAMQHTNDVLDQMGAQFATIGKDGSVTFDTMGDATQAVADGLSADNVKVVALDGSVKSLTDALKQEQAVIQGGIDYGTVAGQQEANSGQEATLAQWIQYYGVQAGAALYAQHMAAVAAGAKLLHDQGVPGYAEGVVNAPGGLSMVGENGPELMYVPTGASIMPSGPTARVVGGGNPSGGVAAGNMTINLMLDGKIIAQIVSNNQMKTAKQNRLYQ